MEINSLTIFGIIGSIASILGLLIAFLQTVKLKKLQRIKNADDWMTLRELLTIIRWTHKSNLTIKEQENQILSKVGTKSTSIYRQILKQIILQEKDFDSKTLESWIQSGKIDERWQLEEAKKHLTTKKKKLISFPLLDDKPNLESNEPDFNFRGKFINNSVYVENSKLKTLSDEEYEKLKILMNEIDKNDT